MLGRNFREDSLCENVAFQSGGFVTVCPSLQRDEPVFGAGQVEAATLLKADVVALPLDGPVQLDAVLKRTLGWPREAHLAAYKHHQG